MQPEYFALEGLNLLMRTIGNVKKQLNPHLEVLVSCLLCTLREHAFLMMLLMMSLHF